jgi:hypothetical protein
MKTAIINAAFQPEALNGGRNTAASPTIATSTNGLSVRAVGLTPSTISVTGRLDGISGSPIPEPSYGARPTFLREMGVSGTVPATRLEVPSMANSALFGRADRT